MKNLPTIHHKLCIQSTLDANMFLPQIGELQQLGFHRTKLFYIFCMPISLLEAEAGYKWLRDQCLGQYHFVHK